MKITEPIISSVIGTLAAKVRNIIAVGRPREGVIVAVVGAAKHTMRWLR